MALQTGLIGYYGLQSGLALALWHYHVNRGIGPKQKNWRLVAQRSAQMFRMARTGGAAEGRALLVLDARQTRPDRPPAVD